MVIWDYMFSTQEHIVSSLPRCIRCCNEDIDHHSVTHMEAVLHCPKLQTGNNSEKTTIKIITLEFHPRSTKQTEKTKLKWKIIIRCLFSPASQKKKTLGKASKSNNRYPNVLFCSFFPKLYFYFIFEMKNWAILESSVQIFYSTVLCFFLVWFVFK